MSKANSRGGAQRQIGGIPLDWRGLAPWVAIALLAFAAGLVARFKGLAVAPVAVDEYYIIQSVRNVLRTGWPEFDCGGWYQRGLLLQYLSAGLNLLGVSDVLAPRLIASVSSVVALPAVFAIGRRAYSPVVGMIAVSLLLVSIWEIEIARFGRMYMPFQAITAWYALYFLRYTVDRTASALLPMTLLSLAGILTWEGGVFLAAANFLPLFLVRERLRLSPAFAGKIVGLGVLVAFGYWLAVADLRIGSDALPDSYTGETFYVASGLFDLAPNYLPTIFSRPLWLVLAVVPLVAGACALRNVFAFRSRPLAAFGLLLAVVAALCGQLVAVAAILVLLVVLRLIDWQELLDTQMLAFRVAVTVSALYWLLFVAAVFDWHGIEAGSFVRWLALLGGQFARIPNIVNVVLWPWARAVPGLGFVMLITLTAAIVRVTRNPHGQPLTAERALLALVLCMLVAAAMSSPPRIETRYTFFLYPLVLLLGVGVLWTFFSARLRRADVAGLLTAVSALAVFALTEDFDVDHLLHVDRPNVLVRADMPPNLATHLVGRGNTLQIVRWLDANVSPGQDIVITDYHVLDFYYANVRYFFADYRNAVFPAWACRRGTVERWTNKPMLSTVDALEAAVPERGSVFLVVFDDGGRLLSELTHVNATLVSSMNSIQIIRIARP